MLKYIPISFLAVPDQAECRSLATKIEDVHLCKFDKQSSAKSTNQSANQSANQSTNQATNQPLNQSTNQSANQSIDSQQRGQRVLEDSLSTCLTKLRQAQSSDTKEVWLSCIKLIFDGPPVEKKLNDSQSINQSVSQSISQVNKQSKFFATYGHTLVGEPASKPVTPVNQWTQPKSKSRNKAGNKPDPQSINQSVNQAVNFSYGGPCAQTDGASTVSTCLIDLLNSFHDKGGFDTLLEILSINQSINRSYDPKPSLSLITAVLRTLANQSVHWVESFSQSFVHDLTDRLRLVLGSYSAADYQSINKSKFDTFFNLWFTVIGQSELLASIIWETKLELSWIFLQGEVFDRRLIAMNTLNEACEAVNQSQSINQSINQSQSMQPDQLLSFLKRHDVLTYVLSIKTSHSELLRRSQLLLSFAHQTGILTNNHYHLLIDWLSTDLEHTLSIAQTIILNLTAMFDFVLNHHLYTEINIRIFKQPSTITISTLQFLYAFSTRTLQNHLQSINQSVSQSVNDIGDGDWMGLVTFWTLLNLPSHLILKPVVRSTCLSLFQSMLRLPICDSQRDYYSIQSISQIKSGNNVSDALSILQSIVLSFPSMIGQKVEPFHHSSQCEYVMWLDRQYSLFGVVIDSAGRERYQVAMEELRITIPNQQSLNHQSVSQKTINQSTNESSFLQAHLNFLLTCFCASTLTLTVPQASRLWNDHFVQATNQSVRQALVSFLHSLLTHRAKTIAPRGQIGHCIDNETCSYLLNECMCNASPSMYDRQSFATFELFFLYVNYQQDLLSSADIRSCVVNSWSLHGLDELWLFLVTCRDVNVLDSASSLLLRIYQSKSSISQIGASDFIKRCISHLSGDVIPPSDSRSAAQIYSPRTPEQSPSLRADDDETDGWMTSSPRSAAGGHRRITSLSEYDQSRMSPSHHDHSTDDDDDEASRNERTSRCLKLLTEFMRGPKGSVVGHTPPDIWRVNIQWKPTSQSAYTKAGIDLSSQLTIADARNQASSLLTHPAAFIDLMGTATTHYNNKVIDQSTTLASVPVQTQTKTLTLTAVKRPVPDVLSPSLTAPADSPPAALAQNLPYYQKLYDLLDLRHPSSIIQPAFNLLQELPVNETLFNSIVKHSQAWKRLLPFHSPLMLLHTLNIILDIAQPKQFESDSLTQLRNDWLNKFVESGGFVYIRDILLAGLSVDACPSVNQLPAGQPIDPSITWVHAMRLKTLGVIINLLILICQRLPHTIDTLVIPPQLYVNHYAHQQQQSVNQVHLGNRLIYLITDLTLGVTAMPVFEKCSEVLVNDCFVSTINQSFKLITLLLSTSTYHSNNPAINQAFKAERSELWQTMYTSHVERLIIDTMLHGRYAPIRRSITANLIEFIVSNQPINQPTNDSTIFHHYSRIVFDALSKLTTVNESTISGEFFDLLRELLNLSIKLNVQIINQSNRSKMIQLIIQLIDSQPPTETRNKRCDSLKGILGFAQALYRCESNLQSDPLSISLIELIYSQCLFSIDMHSVELTAKARHSETRSQAFSTLFAICIRHSANLHCLMSLIYQTQLTNQSNIQPNNHPWEMETNIGSKLNFVGLKNLGNTCYLNSLVQQLTMLPGFAESVLATPAQSNTQSTSQSNTQLVKSDLSGDQLYELQSLFLSLVLSKAQAVVPQPFINQFRFFGEAIDINQQYDVQEFASALFDRVDESLKLTDQSDLLKSTFGGVLNNQIVGLNRCPHKHERAEPFYVLSLNIQHHTDIRESLQEFIKGETLTGDNAYFCSKCAAKVDAERHSLIDQVPNQLILHLKRFEFDYDAMRKRKLNTTCAFPPVLDMAKFTSSQSANDPVSQSNDNSFDLGAPDVATDQSDLFDLVGVIVHSGHADGGHYYSFVKDRFGQASSQMNNPFNNPFNQSVNPPNKRANKPVNPSNKWFQFNDQRVSVFSFDDLALECFGGNEMVKVGDEYVEIEKQRSAYMLFYERRTKLVNQSISQPNKSFMGLPALIRSSSAAVPTVTASIAPSKLPSYLHPLYQSINQSNLSLLNQQLANDPLYAQFLFRAFLHVQIIMLKNDTYPKQSLHELSNRLSEQTEPSLNQSINQSVNQPPNQSPPSLSVRFIRALTLYVVHVLIVSRPAKRLDQFVGLLQYALLHHVPGCHWFIEYFVIHSTNKQSDDQSINQSSLLKRCLIDCSVQSVRHLMMQLIDAPLARLSVFEIDPSINQSVTQLPILEKEKERAFIESEYGSMETLPPVPPRRSISQSASPADTPPTTAPNSPINTPVNRSVNPTPNYPSVDASLGPPHMFRVNTQVNVQSPITVLYGITAATVKSLEKASITNLLALSSLSQSTNQSKQKYNMTMSQTKLSPKQMTDAIERAKEAVSFIRMISGEADNQSINQSNKTSDTTSANQSINQLVVPPHAVIRPFLTVLVHSLRSAILTGHVDGSQTLESVELLNRFANRGKSSIDCLIDCGVIDCLLGLCIGELPQSVNQSNDIQVLVAGAESMPLPPLPQSINQSSKFHPSLDQSSILQLLYNFLKHCRLPHWPNDAPSPLYQSINQRDQSINQSTYQLLISEKFINYLVSSINQSTNQSTSPLTQLLSYFCWHSLDATYRLIDCILRNQSIEDVDRASPWLQLIDSILSLSDGLIQPRVKYFIPRFIAHMAENCLCYRLTDLSLKWFFTQMNASALIQQTVNDHWNELRWITGWTQDCKKPPTKQQPLFLADGRILSLYRDLAREQDLTLGNIHLTVQDTQKTWKHIQEMVNKKHTK